MRKLCAYCGAETPQVIKGVPTCHRPDCVAKRRAVEADADSADSEELEAAASRLGGER